MLSLVDGLNRRADDFRAVRAGVQAERDARSKERPHVGCVRAIGAEQPRPREVEEFGQREVDDEELNQQRRAAEEEDVTAANLAERLKFADLAQRQQGTQNQAEEHGDGRQQDGQLCAVHQVAAAAEHPVGVVNHLPDDLHCAVVRRNNLVAETNVAFRHNVAPAGRDGQVADAEQRVIGDGQALAGALRVLRQPLLHGFRGVRQHFLARGHHGRENPNDDEDEQHNADDDFCFPLPPIDPEQLCGHFSLHTPIPFPPHGQRIPFSHKKPRPVGWDVSTRQVRIVCGCRLITPQFPRSPHRTSTRRFPSACRLLPVPALPD